MGAPANHEAKGHVPPAILSAGFRPFFLAGSLWAVGVTALWVALLSGQMSLTSHFDPLGWHRHEMLFGYLGAIIAGFLLTAIPNWTGRPVLSGAPLAALAGLWLAGRLAILFSTVIGGLSTALVDCSFLFVMAGIAAREIVLAKNRNLPLVVAILLLGTANLLDHLGVSRTAPADLGWQIGFAVVLMLIALIGGRIIPTFTRNWLVVRGEKDRLPPAFNGFDKIALALMAIALVGWIAARGTIASGFLLILAGFIQAARLARWHGGLTFAEPLVFILHLSYAWVPLGLVLLGLSSFTTVLPPSSALHALSAGAMASMTLAVMTRATLGHTGHALHADRMTVAIYALVTSGAVLRLVAPLLPFDYLKTVSVAGALWASAFVLFVMAYGGKLVRPRSTGASG